MAGSKPTAGWRASGTGYALFYKLTGERKYLDAAIRCAQALARHVRPGDADHTPWPFRVDARTGVTLALEEYGGNVAGPLRLFDELISLNAGDVPALRSARDLALKWLLEFPLNHDSRAWNKWAGYFEDIPHHTDDVNQLTPMLAAYYILARENPAEVDPLWMGHVGRLLDWVRTKLGRGPFFGAQAIDGADHAGRQFWLLLAGRTGRPYGALGCNQRHVF